MDKSEYIRLLSAASIDNVTKFARVDDKRPNLRGRPPKHFHPLLQKEKDVHSTLHQILPEDITTSPIRFLRRVQDWPIFMGFPRHTKPNWVWDQFYQPLELTTLTWLNGLNKNWNHFLWTSTRLLVRLNLLISFVPFLWMMKTYTGLLWREGPFLPMYLKVRLLTSWSSKHLPTTGLIKPMILILRKRNLHSSLKLPLPISFFSSMVICMSRLTV